MRIGKTLFITTLTMVIGIIGLYFLHAEIRHILGIVIVWTIGLLVMTLTKLGVLKINKNGRWYKYDDYYNNIKDSSMSNSEEVKEE